MKEESDQLKEEIKRNIDLEDRVACMVGGSPLQYDVVMLMAVFP